MPRKQCSYCNGTGKIYSGPTGSHSNKQCECPFCMGRGHVEDTVQPTKPDTLSYQAEGTYYTSMPMQPWEIIDAHKLGYYEGCVLKYLLRKKPGQSKVLEWQKAIHYLEHLIELEEQAVSDVRTAIDNFMDRYKNVS